MILGICIGAGVAALFLGASIFYLDSKDKRK